MPALTARAQIIISAAAFIAGFLLVFGDSNISVFEWLVCALSTATVFLVVIKGWWRYVLWRRQHTVLAVFAVISLLPFAFVQHVSIEYSVISVYLFGLFGLTQFWLVCTAGSTSVQNYFGIGYLTAVLVSCVLGLGAYLGMVSGSQLLPNLIWGDGYRLSLFFSDPVVLGAFLVPAILWLAFQASQADSWVRFVGWSVATWLVFTILILTGSRGAWINVGVAGLVTFFVYQPAHVWQSLARLVGIGSVGVILMGLILFVIPIQGASFYEHTLSVRSYVSDAPRLENLQAAPRRTLDRPWPELLLGSGGGSYELSNEEQFSAHNTYLRVVYEHGLLGLIAYGWFVFLLVRLLWRKSDRSLMIAVILGSVCGILVHNVFVDTLHWRHFWILAGLIL